MIYKTFFIQRRKCNRSSNFFCSLAHHIVGRVQIKNLSQYFGARDTRLTIDEKRILMVCEILDLKSTKKNSNGARDTSEIDQK